MRSTAAPEARSHDAPASARAGLFVVGCVPESPSARAGLRYGDVVVACNGVPTDGPRAFERARTLRPHALELVVLRRGEEVALEVELDASLADLRASDAHRRVMESDALDTSAPFAELALF